MQDEFTSTHGTKPDQSLQLVAFQFAWPSSLFLQRQRFPETRRTDSLPAELDSASCPGKEHPELSFSLVTTTCFWLQQWCWFLLPAAKDEESNHSCCQRLLERSGRNSGREVLPGDLELLQQTRWILWKRIHIFAGPLSGLLAVRECTRDMKSLLCICEDFCCCCCCDSGALYVVLIIQ